MLFMKFQAFQNTYDNFPPPTRRHVWLELFIIATTIGVLGVCVFYLATDGFTRGSFSDVVPLEKQTLDEMQDAGILVRDATLPCTMQPHIVVKVRWESQQGCYCVSNIGLRNIEIEKILPYIDRFNGLRVINAPYLPSAERDRIAKLVPSLQVTGTQ